MDTFVDERVFSLLENDKYTFFVLGRIMKGECRVLLSDHERRIICHSGNPYPVWIWTPDDVSVNEMEEIYMLAGREFPFDEGYSFNLKYELAEYLIKRAKEDGKDLSIRVNMFAYDCPRLIKPVDPVDGKIHECTMDDVDEIVGIYSKFARETGIDKQSPVDYRESAEYSVKNRNLFFWEDGSGRHVSSCSYRPNGNLASLGLVYTREEYRRKHYAEHLVYSVAKIAQGAGFVPMLYTDADYTASNACYEKLGFILRGKLCTIASDM